MSSESALRQADLQYQGANIDPKIQDYLATTSPGQSVMQFADFVMATGIGLFILTSVNWISHGLCAESMHSDM